MRRSSGCDSHSGLEKRTVMSTIVGMGALEVMKVMGVLEVMEDMMDWSYIHFVMKLILEYEDAKIDILRTPRSSSHHTRLLPPYAPTIFAPAATTRHQPPRLLEGTQPLRAAWQRHALLSSVSHQYHPDQG